MILILIFNPRVIMNELCAYTLEDYKPPRKPFRGGKKSKRRHTKNSKTKKRV